MDLLLILFVTLLLLKLGGQLWLDLLNRKEVLNNAGEVPSTFQGFIDEETYDKTVSYTLAKNKLGIIETLYDGAILAILILTGLLAFLWSWSTGIFGTGVWGQAISLFVVMLLIGLPGIPFEWYSQFRLEERFGFNKSTIKLWITDKIKGLAIGAIIGIPLLAWIIWLVSLTSLWWVYAFIGLFLFQIVMMVVYPMWIMPLFNKFEPLPDGELRRRLIDLGNRTGFQAKTILVMDGSKRSGHSNAFFTGFGKFRRIVLFDTLVEQLNTEQLEAVLAHEIGHYKMGHIPKLIAVAGVSLLISFALIGWLANNPDFLIQFGMVNSLGQIGPVLLLFGLLSGLVTFWTTPLSNLFSRKHEYEADNFAKEALGNDPKPMIESLRILNRENLSNLTPHPTYSRFYYSHPTLIEREASLTNS